MSNQTNNNQTLNANKQSATIGKTLSACLSHLQFGSLIELFNGISEGIFIIDEQGTFEFANPMAAQR